MNCPKFFLTPKGGDKPICIRLVKKEFVEPCRTPPPIGDDFSADDLTPASSSSVGNYSVGNLSTIDEPNFGAVQNVFHLDQESKLCVFSGLEPPENVEVSNEPATMFSLQKMRFPFEEEAPEEASDDEKYVYDENILIRSEEFVNISADGENNLSTNSDVTTLIPLIPDDEKNEKTDDEDENDDEKIEESAKKSKKFKSLYRGHRDAKSAIKCERIVRKVVQRWGAREREANDDSDDEKDPFNLSNDKFYSPLTLDTWDTSSRLMLHSIPAQNLNRLLFPTYLTTAELRNFHRRPLPEAKSFVGGFRSVESLQQHVVEVAKFREQICEESGSGDMFFMREMDDLTGKDGDLILCEYSEENPPLLMQPGMATKIKNLFRKTADNNNTNLSELNFEYGEKTYVKTAPFLGNISMDEVLQILDNNLFRAPIYLHDLPETDFLIIRNSNGYYIRPLTSIYCVGQECPVTEVPAPNSNRAMCYLRDILRQFILLLFYKNDENPRRLKSDVIRQAFPHLAESSIRKRLKMCARFERLGTGMEWNYWLLLDDFNLPSLDRILAMMTPEQYCSYFSMLAAEQRLKDAGYGDECQLFVDAEDDDDADDEDAAAGGNKKPKIDDELTCAPWNTTRAFVSAMKGKHMLDLSGIADPTGRGEGFSYVKLVHKVAMANGSLPNYFYFADERYSDVKSLFNDEKSAAPSKVRRIINGTDADLRKLSLNDARQLLLDLGVTESDIKALKRWEIIDVIRTFSTQQARAGELGLTKYARGSLRFNSVEVQDRYRQECQRLFDLQNRILSCAEYMSTDDEESESEAEENESPRPPTPQLVVRNIKTEVKQEENSNDELSHDGRSTNTPNAASPSKIADRKLKIYRTYCMADGREFVNVEVVSDVQLIDAYLKIRKSKDEEFIKKFARMDKQYKLEKLREKRRLQDRLRRVKRNQLKAEMGFPIGRQPRPPKPPKPIKPSLAKMRCSACRGRGHMKTNKHCPLFKGRKKRSVDDEASNKNEQSTRDDDDDLKAGESLVSIQGTKLSIKKKVVGMEEKKPPKPALKRVSHTKIGSDYETDEDSSFDEAMLSGGSDNEVEEEKEEEMAQSPSPTGDWLNLSPPKKPNVEKILKIVTKKNRRRRADPKVELCNVLDFVLQSVKATEWALPFLKPVSRKSYPDYSTVVARPMDLSTIKVNLTKNLYVSSRQFVDDLQQIATNARRYNGDVHVVTTAAERLFEFAMEKLRERRPEIEALELKISPLNGDDDLSKFSRELNRIVERCRTLPKAVQLSLPSNRKKFLHYAEAISDPTDLNKIGDSCKSKFYTKVEDFLRDVEKIQRNSEIFNGSTSACTAKAKEIVDLTKTLIAQNVDLLSSLEARLNGLVKEETQATTTDVPPICIVVQPPIDSKNDEMLSEMDRRLGNFLPDDLRKETNDFVIKHEETGETQFTADDDDTPLDISEPPPAKRKRKGSKKRSKQC